MSHGHRHGRAAACRRALPRPAALLPPRRLLPVAWLFIIRKEDQDVVVLCWRCAPPAAAAHCSVLPRCRRDAHLPPVPRGRARRAAGRADGRRGWSDVPVPFPACACSPPPCRARVRIPAACPTLDSSCRAAPRCCPPGRMPLDGRRPPACRGACCLPTAACSARLLPRPFAVPRSIFPRLYAPAVAVLFVDGSLSKPDELHYPVNRCGAPAAAASIFRRAPPPTAAATTTAACRPVFCARHACCILPHVLLLFCLYCATVPILFNC